MSFRARGTARLAAGLGVAAATGLGLALSAPASAAPDHVLHASAAAPGAVAPGGTGSFHYTLRNTGSTPTEGVLMNVDVAPWVTVPALTHNPACNETGKDPYGGTLISCAVRDQNGKLAPGQTVTQEVPFTVAKSAPGPMKIGEVAVLVVPLDGNGKPTESWKDLEGPNTVRVPIKTTKNSYDYKVSADSASGKVGDTVTVTATGTNSGPADMYGGDVTIQAPTGTTLVSPLADGCTWVTKGKKVDCDLKTTIVPAGKTSTLTMKFRIDEAPVGDNGSIAVSTKTPGDTDPDNNAAPIAITTTGGSAGGDGTLPVTGGKTSYLAGGGAAVLLAGGAIVFLARRKYKAAHAR